MEIINLLKDILSPQYGVALTLSAIVVIILQFCNKNKSDILSMITNKESILICRVGILVFVLTLCTIKLIETRDFLIFIKANWILLIPYPAYEIFLLIIGRYIISRVKTPRDYCNKLYTHLCNRNNGNGGFCISSNDNRVALWGTSQTIYGLLDSYDNQDVIKYSKMFVNYCEQSKDVIWKKDNSDDILFVPNFWAILALMKIITKVSRSRELLGDDYKKACDMVSSGLDTILALKLRNNGWSPHLKKSQDKDYRLSATIIALWSLSEIISEGGNIIQITPEKRTEIIDVLNGSIADIINNYDNNSGWSNSPYETSRSKNARNGSLSLYVYSVLSIIESNLKKASQSNSGLSSFFSRNHSSMMKKVSYYLSKDIEDNETDSPYDIVHTSSPEAIAVTCYDWLPTVMLAIYTSKLNRTYRKYDDGIIEKKITDTLNKNIEKLNSWYTYRLALMLIGLSINNKSTTK